MDMDMDMMIMEMYFYFTGEVKFLFTSWHVLTGNAGGYFGCLLGTFLVGLACEYLSNCLSLPNFKK